MSPQKTSIRDRIEEAPLPGSSRPAGVLWMPGLLVLLLAAFMAFFQQYFLPVPLPLVGKPAPQAIRAPYDFVFDEEAAVEKVVDDELRAFVPVYEYDGDLSKQILARWEAFFAGLRRCGERADEGRRKAYACLRDLLGSKPPDKVLAGLLRYPHMEKVEALLSTTLKEILERGILPDEAVPEKFSVRRGGVPMDPSETLRLSEARKFVRDRLDLLDLDPESRSLLEENLAGRIEPNLRYAEENRRRLAAIHSMRSEKKRVFYKRGDLLVPRGKVVTRLDYYRVEACLAGSPPDSLLVGMGTFFPFFLMTLVFVLAARRFRREERAAGQHDLLLFFVLFSVLLLAKVLYLFTNLDGVAVPAAAAGLIVALLLDLPTAFLTVGLTALYTSFLTSLDMGLFLYYLIGGFLFVLFAGRTTKRIRLLFYSFLLGGVQVLLLFCVVLLRDVFPTQALMVRLAPQAFLSAPAAWLVAMMIVPLSEKLFGLATADRLRALCDLNHPLLKKLQERAPGTYYHSLAVANLACVVAETVGADVDLVRAGAYYHDIGKIMQPEYFIENQNNRENPHENLEPTASCEIVKAHVKDGVEIARQYHLPQAVVDLIAEHHGTTVLEAFFSKARQRQPDVPCSRDFFRYEGPKPGSIESGILMIADVVEAVGRLLNTTNPLEVRETVHRVVVKKFEDGQFDRCGLTTRVLAQAETVLAHTLLRVLHKRIDYPGGEARGEGTGAVAEAL